VKMIATNCLKRFFRSITTLYSIAKKKSALKDLDGGVLLRTISDVLP